GDDAKRLEDAFASRAVESVVDVIDDDGGGAGGGGAGDREADLLKARQESDRVAGVDGDGEAVEPGVEVGLGGGASGDGDRLLDAVADGVVLIEPDGGRGLGDGEAAADLGGPGSAFDDERAAGDGETSGEGE